MTAQTLHPESRHVLLTGATGFLGTALLEALLRTTDCRVTLLVRPSHKASARERVRTLLRSEAFAPLWAEQGVLALETFLTRISVIEGDLASLDPRTPGAEPAITLPHDIDTVIHSASSVSFDDSLERAFDANVVGPAALYRALGSLSGSPHVIHVSTAYVNAGRVRVGTEQAVRHDVDWRLELAELRNDDALRTDPATGRRHAQRNGWTDTYTFTKALGERVAEEGWADRGHRLTVLRPAIIESAVSRPHRGWLDGFKVADPLIAAYAEGSLTDFPGRRRGTIDIVPVDAVVDTALAAMARPGPSGRTRYLQVATSRVNPLHLRDIQPYIDTALNTYGWPGGETPVGRTRRLRYHSRFVIRTGLRLARRTTAKARRRTLDRFAKFVELYAPYTCNPTTFDTTTTTALLEQYRHDSGEAVDLRSLDWAEYLAHVHVPALGRQRRWWSDVAAVTEQARAIVRLTDAEHMPIARQSAAARAQERLAS